MRIGRRRERPRRSGHGAGWLEFGGRNAVRLRIGGEWRGRQAKGK
jgi:hypothetical protein